MYGGHGADVFPPPMLLVAVTVNAGGSLPTLGADVRAADGWLVGYVNSTTRRRNRTFQAGGCPALPVLKTGWATRPVPRRSGC